MISLGMSYFMGKHGQDFIISMGLQERVEKHNSLGLSKA